MNITPTKLVITAIVLSAFAGGGIIVYNATRGYRNNNPGNIRKTSDKWQGLSVEQTDKEFFQFESAEYGIRALAKLVKNYYYTYGLKTVSKIISRWAPSTENNTTAYISSVASYLGVSKDKTLTLDNDTWLKIVKAIIKHENGVILYSDETIMKGMSLV